MSLPRRKPSASRRVPARTVGAISASVLAFPLVAATAHAGTVPYPTPAKPLPTALDAAPPYQQGTRCLTEAQPGVVAFAKLLNATYGSHVYGILRQCAAEHGEGRALDWMVNAKDPEQLAVGDALTRWLSAPDAQGRPGAMARRFGINYIIWNRQMWRAYAPERGWAPYYGVSPHTDHIHISFTWDGAYGRTSWWTGKPVVDYLTGPLGATPPPVRVITASGYPFLEQGASGPEVALAQKVVGAVPDGRFGPLTASALGTWQARNGVPATKALDNATWSRMVALGLVPTRTGGTGSGSSSGSGSASGSASGTGAPVTPSVATIAKYASTTLRLGASGEAVRVLQAALGEIAVDGSFGPATQARVRAYQRAQGLTVDGVVAAPVWNALMGRKPSVPPVPPVPPKPAPAAAASPLAKYRGLTLRLWSRGEAVKAVQRTIGGLTADGAYGPATQARVKAWQKSRGLPVDGVVDARDWTVLVALTTPKATATPTAKPPTATPPKTAAPPKTAPPTAKPPAGATTFNAVSAHLTTEITPLKGTTLRPGATGAAVRTLQAALGGVGVDGAFGASTQTRVRAVQKAAGLPVTGVVDPATWEAVERRAHPLLPHWGTILKRGSRGPAVVALQKALRITADGSYGATTEAAVRSAQRTAKLTQTGVVAVLTWKAVEARMR